MLIFDIRWTGVTKLPSSMSQLTQLKSLLLEEDSMVRPPATICQHGTDAILQYLFALLETRATKACTLQLNFLGEVARGKTSLSRTLQSGTPSLTSSVDRTSVVEQGTWNPEDHIRFNINDFGGHQSYRVGHPLFISEAGVVCIVFNSLQYDPLSEEDFTNNIGDWIDMIQSRYPGIDLVVLGTHVDRCDEVKVDEIRCSIQRRMQAQAEKKQMLLDQQIEHLEEQISRNRRCDLPFLEAYRDKYENLKSLRECTKNKTHPIFMVSSQTLLGFGDLEIYLIKLAEAKKVELPKRWLDLASTILKDSGNLLTIDYDYLRQKFMKLNDVTIDLAPTNASSEFNNVMCFLASSGEIIWFEKHPALKNTIFHRQRLLADLLRVVLDHNNYARVNFFLQEGLITQMEMDDYTLRGIVSRNLLKNLWKTFNLNHFDIDTMTELLKSLELCYEVPCKSIMSKDSAYHFPCLLTEGKPEHLSTKWPHEISHEKHQLSLRFQFHHGCPCGVYEKFSVRLHRHLGLFKLRRVDWKDGLYAELGANSILVLRQQRGRECTITISVRGKKIPQLWEHLLNAHNDLLKIQTRDWPGLHFTKHLICPHCERLCLPNPSVFPGEILDLERPSNETRGFYSTVPCDNAVPDRCIPASMVIPAMAEFAPMAEYNKAALRAHQKALVDDITEPCLRDVLLRFQQEGIFSEREVLTVKSRDSQRERNVIFLDILRTKEERAFYEFTRYLGANGQLHLSELLQL
ncbi:malignant fibrous histiocytoma-amplified sequence 1 homolog [Lingula anatina]|uniref:Malignant fibrous histiocytoma-amplified sequence 1 homolog n=1 Tax=Lingula anatina TaxID=7574 RepID=A0A1S3GYH8_LINAN|nr:malignant fibrous histiocytoma-amplified sequence 1 homolog [Lingula anatina]|eukprot:XP_013378813.1 malignant fibrous histiocytoma-amplified sequence 1 homolog [Lingula anatina]